MSNRWQRWHGGVIFVPKINFDSTEKNAPMQKINIQILFRSGCFAIEVAEVKDSRYSERASLSGGFMGFVGIRRKVSVIAAALWLIAFAAFSAPAQTFQPVADGIEHLQMIRGATATDEATGPFVINLLRVDLGRVAVKVVHALDAAIGVETVSSLAARYRAIAAINGGFFVVTGTYRGDAVSALMTDGRLLSEPVNRRAAVGFVRQNGKTQMVFGHLQFAGAIELAGGRSITINGLNRQRGNNEVIVYTPEFHRTTLTLPDGVEILVRQNRVTIVRDHTGSNPIPEDGIVVSASGTRREELLKRIKKGMRLKIRTILTPLEAETKQLWQMAQAIVGGSPQLIHKGRLEISRELEGIKEEFVTTRHPRTAIASLPDGKMLLATVDGRQPGVSVGMSLTQFASLLLEFGAVEAINLDGGGSTAMVVNHKLVNKPSDAAGERAVSDAILIFQKTGKSK